MKYLLLAILFMLGAVGLEQVEAAGMEPSTAEDILVVGGGPITLSQAPWQVSLIKRASSSHLDGVFCGGTVVASDWILTAAHCLFEENAGDKPCKASSLDSFWVGSGSVDLGNSVSLARPAKVVLAGGYDCRRKQHDLALIQLSGPVVNAASIAMPSEAQANSSLQPLSKPRVSGWGKTLENGWKSIILMRVEVPIISYATCKTHYGDELPVNAICAGEIGKDSCKGDSGSPMYDGEGRTAVLLGVVSFGDGCGQTKVPGVYVSVLPYKDWIAKTTACVPAPNDLYPRC